MSIDTSRGYVAFPRGLTDWEWYDDINTSRVFFHLFLTANWEAKSWRGVVINPGDKVTSIAHLSEETGLTPREVRTALHHLTATNYLTIRTTRRFSVISINNWAVLTGADKLSDKQTTHCRHTGDMLATTTKPLKPLEPLKREGEEAAAVPPSPPAPEMEAKKKYGPYENVLLTDSEMQKLTEEFPKDYQQKIDRLSEYMASTGKTYKNHLATIRSWARRDRQEAKQGANLRAGKGVTRDPGEAKDFLVAAADRPRRLKRKD